MRPRHGGLVGGSFVEDRSGDEGAGVRRRQMRGSGGGDIETGYARFNGAADLAHEGG
jgi:hypothetical protein